MDGIKDHYELCSELEQQQNEAKANHHVGLEPHILRCPKPVRLEGTSFLRLMIIQVITGGYPSDLVE